MNNRQKTIEPVVVFGDSIMVETQISKKYKIISNEKINLFDIGYYKSFEDNFSFALPINYKRGQISDSINLIPLALTQKMTEYANNLEGDGFKKWLMKYYYHY